MTACQGLGASSQPSPTPSPTPGTIQSVNHIIIMLQENRSFDSYLGNMTTFRQQSSPPIPINSSDGKIRDLSDAVGYTNPSPVAGDIAPFRTGSVCTENLSPDWEEHHIQINRSNPAAASPTTFDMKGFVPVAFGESQAFANQGIFLADQTGRRAMGFFDERSSTTTTLWPRILP